MEKEIYYSGEYVPDIGAEVECGTVVGSEAVAAVKLPVHSSGAYTSVPYTLRGDATLSISSVINQAVRDFTGLIDHFWLIVELT